MEFLNILTSCNSQLATMNMFMKGGRFFVPDMILIFFYVSVCLLDRVIDRIFFGYILFYEKNLLLSTVFIPLAAAPLIPLIMNLQCQKATIYRSSNCFLYIPVILLTVLGLDPIYVGVETLKDLIKYQQNLQISRFYYFVRITEEKLLFVKGYCYLLLFTKIIPQLIFMPILITESNFNEFGRVTAFISMSVNILVFSSTVAITFPIRKNRPIYKKCICLLMSSFSKFMATVCACCLHLIIFTVVYRYIGSRVLIVPLVKFLLWLYPSYYNIRHQPYYLPHLHLFVHGLGLALISAFIYIQPFHEVGSFFYYFFNLLSFLVDSFSIYVLSESSEELKIAFVTLTVLIHIYVSCFRVTHTLFSFTNEYDGRRKMIYAQELEKISSQAITEIKSKKKNSSIKTDI